MKCGILSRKNQIRKEYQCNKVSRWRLCHLLFTVSLFWLSWRHQIVLTTLPNLWIETASNFKTHLATVSDEASREHLATPHSSEPPIYPGSLSRLRFVLHFIFWWRRSQPNGGWPEPGPSPPAILVLASLTQAIQGLLGMGEWSMRLELTAAKMKNTGSIIKHVFT